MSPAGQVLLFGPDGQADAPRRDGDGDDGGTEVYDLLDRYSNHRLFQIRVVRREALIKVAGALRASSDLSVKLMVTLGNNMWKTPKNPMKLERPERFERPPPRFVVWVRPLKFP
jgi:hypothetical protein